jgi:hypothetical protein
MLAEQAPTGCAPSGSPAERTMGMTANAPLSIISMARMALILFPFISFSLSYTFLFILL